MASIYRWQRSRQPSKGRPSPTPAQQGGIDAALARLLDERNDDRDSFLEALFKFIAWLRWPTVPGDHPAAITACIVSYLTQDSTAQTLDELPPADLTLALRHIRVDVLRRICSFDALTLPIFDVWEWDGHPYSHLDLVSDVAWFLIAYEPTTDRARDTASLDKAFRVMQGNGFKYKWKMSKRTFTALWLKLGPAAPFHYIERYHPGLEFSIDPAQPGFAAAVDEIFAQPDELRLYIARCCGVIALLRQRLDPRSLQAVSFPNFPPGFAAEAISPPPLPKGAYVALKHSRFLHKPL
ncbi:hypothetical protein [Methylobacterium longum]|uniref:Uncharacterized protein n=1 Tax=Methylobacterium longum TaxID=767694 RepID=A0ABT8AJV8_9HYPH|nr:hypothetical protein [Methylobacterium longum]MDN3570167.1 hypothetical protein [Methylobacterium longum]